MTVRERMLALSLMERAEKNAEYVKRIGVTVAMKESKSGNVKENKNV